MQIRLFHLQNSRSQRIIWFLEELGLNYKLTIKDHSGIDKDKNSPHQLSKFPAIEIIEQGKTSILAETSAILDYLSHLHPQLGPNSLLSQQLQNFYYWKNYSEAIFIPDLVLKQIFHQIVQRYLAQIENRPAFKNALIKGRWSASTFKAYWTTAW
ncbi:glutathione S-transferase N-terminal domain-containing protein [Acinetobacter pittii]|uniref:glutathione S-transferase N-terminal domain-containing protein n=1 Tax=Acinetobacter pittii TaxID=48296 RepID=UPI002A01651E|nr:glutathione S-transferase N-terminal domain-containing protein [Acinetobacter pittii]MDX8154139.1 glutathione S-transferase N-terminal domain-containing protein [Acinetobacter pittii]